MSPLALSTDEINRRGCEALVKALGPAGYVRFMRQFVGRAGDYSRRRAADLAAVDLSDLQKRFERSPKRSGAKPRPGKKR